MYEIKKQFTFEAAHHLNGLPPGHPCARQHGHGYRVELVLQSETLNEYGFVLDYGELDRFGDWLKANYDHRDLNEILPYKNGKQPSAENIAHVLFTWCRHEFRTLVGGQPELIIAVRVSETAKTWAEYRI